jgi:hypothetical protein
MRWVLIFFCFFVIWLLLWRWARSNGLGSLMTLVLFVLLVVVTVIAHRAHLATFPLWTLL